jgi:Tol biopolymer transport system component
MTVDPQGTHRTVLWNNPSPHYINEDGFDWPRWSPDGSKLVFLGRTRPGYPPTQIWIVGADGHGLTRIA